MFSIREGGRGDNHFGDAHVMETADGLWANKQYDFILATL